MYSFTYHTASGMRGQWQRKYTSLIIAGDRYAKAPGGILGLRRELALA